MQHRTILLKEPNNISLVVESPLAIVLEVKPYDMCANFLPEVRHKLIKNSEKEHEYLQQRSEQIFRSLDHDIKRDMSYTK